MNNVIRKIAAGALAFVLTAGCCGCGHREVVHKPPHNPVEFTGGPVSPHLLKLANLTIAPQ